MWQFIGGELSMKTAFFCALVLLISGCSLQRTNRTTEPLLLSGIDFGPIGFKEGQPVGKEEIDEALAENFFAEYINHILDVIIKNDHLKFEILGFTDSRECAKSDCQALALRRAESVRDWLLANGVKKASISRIVAYGPNMPIDDNASEEGRARNRRVEVAVDPERL
jgi:OmpA family